MGMLEMLGLKSKDPKETLRKSLHKEFKDVALQAIKDFGDDEMTGGLLVQAAIGNFYQGMKKPESVTMGRLAYGVTESEYLKILDEECTKTLKKNLVM